jgi:phosphoglycerate-specific signal transduction histidine kinase
LKSEKALHELNDSLEILIREKIEEVRKLDRMLLQQARLAAIGEILTSISRHWRQPLTSISTIIQNLRHKRINSLEKRRKLWVKENPNLCASILPPI